MACSQDASSVLDAFHIVTLTGDAPGEVRRRVQQDTLGHRRRKDDPLYPGPQSFARLTHARSPHVNKNDSERPSRQMRRISVSKLPTTAPASARGLPPSHTHPRPTPGLTPHPAPTSLPHPRNRPPGPNPTQMEGRTRRLLRHSRSQQRTTPKPSTDIIELGRHTARGYPNPTNYQPRMPLTTAGLGTSPHPTMQSRNRTRRVVGVGPRSCGVDR